MSPMIHSPVLLVLTLCTLLAQSARVQAEPGDAKVDAAASDIPESVRVEQVLIVGQINSSTVDVGAFVVVIYGQGERHPVSGAWTQLDTVKGSIKAVDSRRLIVGLEPDGWSKWIALEHIQTLSLIGAGSADRDHTLTRTTKRVQPAQAEPEDSLKVKDSPPLFDIDDKGLRIFAKAGAGIITSAATTAPLIGMILWMESLDDESSGRNDIGSGVGIFIFSLFSHTFGSPIGVTLVDPHDSPNETLRWAQIGGLGGLGVGVVFAGIPEPLGAIGSFAAIYLGPVVGSIYGSEKSRKPPQAHRISVDLVPAPNRGLSAVATLRF